jgi:four helix bundle protein
MNQFKNLIVWQKSIKLAGKIYKLTERLPVKERFGLAIQINRAVVSIASNIAKGSGRNSNKQFAHFLSISMGSAYEIETQLIICTELNYFQQEEIKESTDLVEEIQKMLYKLINSLES